VARPKHNIRVVIMTAREFRRWLAKQGCTFESHKGGSGHLTIIRGERRSQLPMHGGGKELGTGLINKIKKDLGLD
jgi:mRNA interferase HicA